ncbi:hypothetical protein [Nitrosomonas eutropha]|uniref:Uncharacterized protein n=1 Tax=Nitrosomonas eutropha TaxID=916 RepID=A0ABX5M6K9_9PROT|nr:hypothetical protein [Nitrosomonas sp. GH22]PXV76120.1 hypothetical protein C8R14_13423 [Nitrosomonas eutropha]SCX10341.1 hypothetical protein SAMN05216379_10646 [Nitrosomonas eutropha]SDW02871.1 hypothetical protein SAMN05216317_101179 [Nitrosomonas eutropha]SEI78030.1 hypothetical protein SAMN05216318_11120 [Nitrosomonas eutropha]
MIVDASLIAAPPSTRNTEGKRKPEMHSSKKGNSWHFGANLLCSEETLVLGDAGVTRACLAMR